MLAKKLDLLTTIMNLSRLNDVLPNKVKQLFILSDLFIKFDLIKRS